LKEEEEEKKKTLEKAVLSISAKQKARDLKKEKTKMTAGVFKGRERFTKDKNEI